jgi:radial spoke head protein 9
MNADDLNQKISYIQQANGVILNIEERAALQSSLSLLKRNGKFRRVAFWGKLFGMHHDYLIAIGYGENLLKSRKIFCSPNGVEWVQLPEVLSQETKDLCKKIRGRFFGDLSHEYSVEVTILVEATPVENGKSAKRNQRGSDDEDEEEEEEEEEKVVEAPKPPEPPKEKKVKKTVSEEKRLAYTVELIDHDTALVPRGAVSLDATHVASENVTFEGLKGGHASQLRSYCHFRQPETTHKRTLLQKEGLSISLDFLDTIDEDIPKGCWTIQEDKVSPQVTIRSLMWPGFYFYHVPATPYHGYVYFGFGEKNTDLGFML